MSDLDLFQSMLRERFASLGDALVTEVSPLFAAVDQLRDRVAESEQHEQTQKARLEQLEERASGLSALIETMRHEAEESRRLRELLQEREIEIERHVFDLESKREIINALRRQLGEMRAALENRGEETSETAIDRAELAALKSELEARKAQIKTLRTDAERVDGLKAQLDDSRAAAIGLEQTIDQHVETIARLKHGISSWKEKYQAAQAVVVDSAESSSEIPSFTASEVEALAEFENDIDGPDCTVTIDMSQALHEARRRRAAVAEP